MRAFILKVDFEKAFDCVSWNFLDQVMNLMGFGAKWRSWIMGCLSSAKVSILINGTPSAEFKMQRGLRQGDPLSPFLFLLAAEALQRSIQRACEERFYSGLHVGNINVSLLQYADDALIFGRWDKGNIERLWHILRLYQRASGLKINIDKSRLFGVGIDIAEVKSMADVFNCKADSCPFIYLGMPVGEGVRRKDLWRPVIKKFEKRLAQWKSKLLSIGGRLTLCNAVLDSLPVYYMSLFWMTNGVIKDIDRLRRRFLWGIKEESRGINWISWDKVTAPKSLGGLAVKDLRLFNLSMLGKWRWRWATDVNSLWFGVISGIHGNHDVRHQKLTNSIWRGIVKSWERCKEEGINLDKQIKREVGDGRSTKFWNDNWCCLNAPLKDSFPRLFAAEMNKEATVADRMMMVDGSWKFSGVWRSAPRGRTDVELQQLSRIMQPTVIQVNKEDKWEWKKGEKGTFSVNSLFNALMLIKYRDWSDKIGHGWNSWIPGKVNICVWRGIQNRLPTKVNLRKRGVDLPSSLCVLCEGKDESTDHVIFECPKVVNIWKKVSSWWGRKYDPSKKWNLFKEGSDGKRFVDISGRIFHGVLCITVWAIWYWRNQIVFAQEEDIEKVLQMDIFPNIQSFALRWIKARCGKKNISWDVWISNPASLS